MAALTVYRLVQLMLAPRHGGQRERRPGPACQTCRTASPFPVLSRVNRIEADHLRWNFGDEASLPGCLSKALSAAMPVSGHRVGISPRFRRIHAPAAASLCRDEGVRFVHLWRVSDTDLLQDRTQSLPEPAT